MGDITSEEIRLLLSAVIYLAGVPLFWARAVQMLSTDEEMLDAARSAPDGLARGVIRIFAGLISLFWFALLTWELLDSIWDRLPWHGDADD